VKKGDSALITLAKEPFLRLYAPPEIVPEVERALRDTASKRKMDENRLMSVWRTNLLPLLTLQRPESLGAWFRGTFIMGKRDIKDVPYVALSFDFQMHGVVTRDLDILDQPQVRTWKIGKVKQVVTVMKKGSLVFVASSELLFPLLAALFQFAISFLKALFNLAREVAKAIGDIIAGVVREIKKLPDWAKFALAFVTILAISNERSRNEIANGLRSAAEMVAGFLNQLLSALQAVIVLLAPLIEIPVALALTLLKDVAEAVVELRALSSSS